MRNTIGAMEATRNRAIARRSYAPYREATLQWLAANRELLAVREAREAITTLYARGGAPEEVFRLAGRPPAERASKVWARLRVRQVDPSVPLAIWISVQLRHQDDHQPERKLRYRLVQTGKGLHRLAGGTHKRWEQYDSNGKLRVVELHKYPASRGLILWALGERPGARCKAAGGALGGCAGVPRRDDQIGSWRRLRASCSVARFVRLP